MRCGLFFQKLPLVPDPTAVVIAPLLRPDHGTDERLPLFLGDRDLFGISLRIKGNHDVSQIENGVPELYLLDREETLKKEPNVSQEVKGSLYAKTGAVINPWDLTLAMAEVAVKNGVSLFRDKRVISIRKERGVFVLETSDGTEFRSRYVVNAAGVNSDSVHEMIGQKEFTVVPTKGEYFLLDKTEGKRVNHVVFQCPNELGKGVLVSPTVHGNLIIGPDANVVTYRDDRSTTSEGLDYVRKVGVRSVPSISFRENIRNFAGVRANTEFDDFCIGESKSVKGFLNLAGIKSP